ncbi:hypothetical protein NC653_007279 [Populus alba x Populus x berolinensis]|uniref:Uncharacterized protein n=1 Tax=Populus alba x Populus x berolinensis TaxID=444605 RepID=A0AAD6RGI0_9ROSI|nr:hypothetical protein NC653_007279 [Populus alba x Populus x berolinensis]
MKYVEHIIPNLTMESSTEPIKRTVHPLVICFKEEIASKLLLSSNLIYFYLPFTNIRHHNFSHLFLRFVST